MQLDESSRQLSQHVGMLLTYVAILVLIDLPMVELKISQLSELDEVLKLRMHPAANSQSITVVQRRQWIEIKWAIVRLWSENRRDLMAGIGGSRENVHPA